MPTKLIIRPTSDFTDSLISSIGALYLTIISFVLIYTFVGLTLYLHNQTLPALFAMDRLLVLRELSSETHFSVTDAKIKDLPNFFSGAADDRFDEVVKDAIKEDELANETQPRKSEKTPSKFTEELLQNSQVLRDIPMRMAIGGTCNVLVTRLFPGHDFNLVTFVVVVDTYTVKSQDVQFAIFRECELGGGGSEFKIVIFKLDDGQFAFAVPRSLAEQFQGPPTFFGFSHVQFPELDQIAKLVPAPMAQYVEFFSEQYVILHRKAVDYFVLNYAKTQLKKHFYRLDDAVQQVYEQKENDASYFGITAPNILLVKIGPIIYFVLSFELWRRVRRLPTGKFVSDRYWFAFETRDIVGRLYSTLYVFLPLLFGILIYTLFVISQGLVVFPFSRLVKIAGLFLTVPMILKPWVTTDSFAMVIALVLLVPLHFLILVVTVTKLARVAGANRRQTIT